LTHRNPTGNEDHNKCQPENTKSFGHRISINLEQAAKLSNRTFGGGTGW
jgi:hypothetical protein